MCDLAKLRKEANQTQTTGKNGTKIIERGAHKGKGMAVFTSGGDSQVLFNYLLKNYLITPFIFFLRE